MGAYQYEVYPIDPLFDARRSMLLDMLLGHFIGEDFFTLSPAMRGWSSHTDFSKWRFPSFCCCWWRMMIILASSAASSAANVAGLMTIMMSIQVRMQRQRIMTAMMTATATWSYRIEMSQIQKQMMQCPSSTGICWIGFLAVTTTTTRLRENSFPLGYQNSRHRIQIQRIRCSSSS